MPFCTQCGHAGRAEDLFCQNCGARQPASTSGSGFRPAAPSFSDPLDRITPRTAAILCYIPTIGWIPSVIVLAARRYKGNHILRFHAFQGLYIFACWLAVNWVLRPMILALPEHFIRVDHILEALLFGTWIFMMIKASRDQPYVLPIIGELAQRSAAE